MSRKRAAVLAAVAMLAALVAWVPGAFGAQASGFDTRFVDLPARDGVLLRTMVMEPKSPGPHPLAIVISAWGGGVTQNTVPAVNLANKGYTVLAYGTRGFGESGGEVQVAGRQDLTDVSDVIDWGLANTESDPNRIGVAGVSYGAGIGVLASGTDPRIKAVASMSGWSDLVRSLSTENTRHSLTALVLHLSGKQNGRLSFESDQMLAGIYDPNLTDAQDDAIKAWSQQRSPINRVAEINRNQPATLMIQTWSETVFEPGQMADLYTQLTGPKRLEILPGDHAATESGGLLGLPSGVWNSVYRWFDAHVAGTDTAIAAEAPIQVVPRPGTNKAEPAGDWAAVQGQRQQKLYLGAKPAGMFGGDAQLLPSAPPAAWKTEVNANKDTLANGGIPLATYSLEALSGNPPTAMLQVLDRSSGGMWNGPKAASAQKIRGYITAHLVVSPPKAQGTVVAYVYDVDRFGTGKLINYTPYTWRGATPGAPLPLDLRFTPTAYNLAAGHRLALVVDSKDALFIDKNTDGGKLGFLSSPADPSWIDVPFAG
ncbi:putative ABC transporter ATP-binding protein [Actinokineospora spheciospongiae]|uniref:Putative ABC transporter ATP-binding protein n=1 Tax=Actinokineospora spheciospongiae TaxID=909613 RepID=W7J047_9PSEU|nr:CocE/NonD family hydrolase [Actinokineospora spheciospongiae]EWC62236.1 putative ABC transporter ATP-binding protein [Actinokineospora spheciospongiae]PWW59403.1 putative CocE/NonD family hydrolase [Actinokineospora spheciospongiae]